MSKEELVKIVSMLRGAYSRAELLESVAEADVWYECLRGLEFEWMKKAAIQRIQKNEFPPTIAEVWELAKKVEQQAYEKGEAKRWQ